MSHSPHPRSPDWQWPTRLVAAVFLLSFVLLVIYRFSSLLTPLVLVLMFSYILNPVVTFMDRRFGISRGLAVLIVYLVLILAFLGIATALGVAIGQQVIGLAAGIKDIAVEFPQRLTELSQSSFQVGPFVLDMSRVDFKPVLERLVGAIQPVLSRTGSIVGSVASATASAVGLVLLVMVLGYYMLHDFPDIDDAALRLVPEAYRPDFERLFRETSQVWSAFLRGQLILGIVIGSVVTVATMILGVRFQFALGILAGLMEFIPIFGPLIAGLVGVVVALFQESNWLGLSPGWFALAVAGMYLIVQQVENNILVPRIIGESLNLHPLAVLIGAIAGGVLAGILGLLLAAPLIATMRVWGGYLYRKILDLDPFPEPPPAPPAPPGPEPEPSWVRRGVRAFLARLKIPFG